MSVGQPPKKRTKAQEYLAQALLDLLKEKRYEEISVKALVKKAGVSRSFFYAQYQDKYDFEEQFITAVIDEQIFASVGILPQIPRGFSKRGFIDYYTRFLQHIADHREMYTLLLGEHGLPAFRRRFRSQAIDIWRQKYIKDLDRSILFSDEKHEVEILFEYVISAHIAVLDYWLFQNPQLSPRYVADQLMKQTWNIIEVNGLKEILKS